MIVADPAKIWRLTGVVALMVMINLRAIGQENVFAGYEHLFTPPLHYPVYHTAESLVIDGRLDEPAWQRAPWSGTFVDIEGSLQPQPPLRTQFRMLWSDSLLFIAAELDEPQLWATLRQRDTVVYQDNDFEVFIDPDGDGLNYFEFEINALNTVFDLFLPRAYRDGGPALITWNTTGLKSAVFLSGTLNNPEDTDQRWSLEMSVPFRELRLNMDTSPPKPGEHFRINFSRVQWDLEKRESGYIKKVNPATGKPFPEHNWVWSPQGIINMHYPERWGYAYFYGPGQHAVDTMTIKTHSVKDLLWLCYYKQKSCFGTNRKYATLSELGLPRQRITLDKRTFTLTSAADQDRFIVTATDAHTGEQWFITEQGVIRLKGTEKKQK